MRRNERFKRLKTDLSQPSAPQILNSLSNYGTNWPHKSKTPSTSCDHRVSIQLNQHTRSSKDRTIGTGILWPHWEHGLSSTKTLNREDHGHRTVLMHGYLALRRTTTGVTCTTCPKHEDTGYQPQQICFHNIASPHHSRLTRTLRSCRMSFRTT